MLHYIDAARRQNREEVCFIKGKSKHLVSTHRGFREENINIFSTAISLQEKQVDFFSFLLSFLLFPHLFSGKDSPFF